MPRRVSNGGATEFAPVGETAFVAEAARTSDGLIAGIVSHADLRLENLDDVLDAHVEAGRGLFRGIRHSLACADPAAGLSIPGRAPAGLFADVLFERVSHASAHAVSPTTAGTTTTRTASSWNWPRPCPARRWCSTTSAPRSVSARYAGQREEIYEVWERDIADIARCENVVAKLGGLAMPDNGFGWNTAARPPTSDEFVAAQGRYYLHTLEHFGADRCMFESNFPVDRMSLSYRTLVNGVKKILSGCSAAERDAVFFGDRAARLPPRLTRPDRMLDGNGRDSARFSPELSRRYSAASSSSRSSRTASFYLDLDLVLVDRAISIHVDTGDRGPLDDVGHAVTVDVNRHRRRLLHDVRHAVTVDVNHRRGGLAYRVNCAVTVEIDELGLDLDVGLSFGFVLGHDRSQPLRDSRGNEDLGRAATTRAGTRRPSSRGSRRRSGRWCRSLR